MTSSIGPGSKIILLNASSSRQWIREHPKSDHFLNTTAPNAHMFRDEGQDHKLSLRNERQSFGLHQVRNSGLNLSHVPW